MVVFIITVALAFHCFDDWLWNRTTAPSYSQSSILPVFGLFVAPLLLFGGYALVTDKIVSEYENKAPRDPATGILHDAEPRGKTRDFAKEGYIGLQNHDSNALIHFKNIYVKEL